MKYGNEKLRKCKIISTNYQLDCEKLRISRVANTSAMQIQAKKICIASGWCLQFGCNGPLTLTAVST